MGYVINEHRDSDEVRGIVRYVAGEPYGCRMVAVSFRRSRNLARKTSEFFCFTKKTKNENMQNLKKCGWKGEPCATPGLVTVAMM